MNARSYPTGGTKIKLCGITLQEEIPAVIEASPDYVGFVFAKESRRYLSLQKAKELKKMLPPEILTVGVFVREDPEVIAEMFREGIIDLAQLHGGEGEDYKKELRSKVFLPILQGYSLSKEGDWERAKKSTAEYLLFDSPGGGSGIPFDWSLLGTPDRPYFLAGGLTPENVTEALDQCHPFGVDVSSGIETGGKKDPDKIRRFVQSVREWNRKEEHDK